MGKAKRILRRQKAQPPTFRRGIPELQAELRRSEEARKDAERMVAAVVLAVGGKVTIPESLIVAMKATPVLKRWQDTETNAIVIEAVP